MGKVLFSQRKGKERLTYLEQTSEFTDVAMHHGKVEGAEVLVEGEILQILYSCNLLLGILHYQCRRSSFESSFEEV